MANIYKYKHQGQDGSAFYNYKGQHSIVLLAIVDANYKFLYVNVGMNGRISDGGVYRESDICKAIEQNILNFPDDTPLPSRTKPVPFVIVADAAFPLSQHVLKPYPFKNMTKEQRVFNYRLSRARRVVENAFGILANRFRVLLHINPLGPTKAKVVTQCCCVLHNFLKTEVPSYYIGDNTEAELDHTYTLQYGLSAQGGNRVKNEILAIREEFKQYVNQEGAVSWQESMI
ncbi:uncharacterized protein LOC116163884 [Photinus pyralis]|uniref:uncharacterized protein LOC116163884 n=1 Tax=Photinus pyralis TaxID=7054 RepID=UPI0012677E93|nr:uncharacterized protein LOC116163884 [Photinus pyralis]